MSDKKPHNETIAKLLAKKREHEQRLNATDLFAQLIKGNKSTLSESITLVESQKAEDKIESQKLIKLQLPVSGNSIRIGITGVPGAGKSTVIESFGLQLISLGKKVAVLAIDPSSEKSGGSILGDKTRMVDLSTNPNAFIRPSATAGSLGGVARKTRESIILCEAAGFDVILIETVGVGQSELDIAEAADTTVVVLVPESGDAVQAMKAGLMEIADVFVMNKSDRPGSQQAVASLQTILMMRDHDEKSWLINIIRTIAVQNKGIDEIANEIERHKEYLISNNLLLKKREQKSKTRIKHIVEDKIREELWSESGEISLNLSLFLSFSHCKLPSFSLKPGGVSNQELPGNSIQVNFLENKNSLASFSASIQLTEEIRDIVLTQSKQELVAEKGDWVIDGDKSAYRIITISIKAGTDVAAQNRTE